MLWGPDVKAASQPKCEPYHYVPYKWQGAPDNMKASKLMESRAK